MEGDWNTCCEEIDNRLFQSTPSAWRETHLYPPSSHECKISIHSLRMEGDSACEHDCTSYHISIHSLRMEGDSRQFRRLFWNYGISIHSLRMEGDCHLLPILSHLLNFNPLPPHGGRHWYSYAMSEAEAFQSTPSAWRETECYVLLLATHINFNPLPPHGGRLQVLPLQCDTRRISIHSLRMEGDRHWKKS